jgi:transcriptional regulator with XRE-family HTH domain
MPRVRKLGIEERRGLRHALHADVEAGGVPWSEAIRRMRVALGLTQEQFAKAFRMTKRQVSDLESGTANPTAETLVRIGRPFGYQVGYILRELRRQPGQKADEELG